ncbi:MAG TPA: sugar ABC transporter permease [Anaerolineales bacterium]|nr:sugar ABC transporter permease [Anaerolineales bacterium]
MKLQKRVSTGVRLLVAVLLIYFSVFPILWIISASLNPGNTLSTASLVPRNIGFDNFKTLLKGDPTFGCSRISEAIPTTFTGAQSFESVILYCTWLKNSIKISSITTLLSISITTMAAYAFSRFRFRGRQTMLKGILIINVFPGILALVAIFLMVSQIGDIFPSFGLNTHAGLILVYMGGTMGVNIWLMKGYLDTIPRDIDESAMVDGASQWQIFTRLILPLLRPILIVVGILSFIGTYGDFILARILLKSSEHYTLMVGLQIFTAGQFSQKWGAFAAGALIGALPIMIIYLLLQDYIVGGLTQGAVKG